MGSTFVELIPNEKRPRYSWDTYAKEIGARGLASAHRWLKKGHGVGILVRSPLWVLDADSASEVERIVSTCMDACLIPLMVRTPSGGAHFYFLLPDSFRRDHLKNHLCHPKNADGEEVEADWKFGPRTMVVAPGSTRDGVRYLPDRPWTMPQVADPRMFLPHGKFWKEHRSFLVDTRPLNDRLARARYYLEKRAPVSVNGKKGSKVLAGVCSHLVAFLALDPPIAVHLLTSGKHPWNGRCIDMEGNPSPWSSNELWNACWAAVDSVPAAGVKAWERAESARKHQGCLDTLVDSLEQSLTLPGTTRVPVERVRRLFGWFGLPDLTPKKLGDHLSSRGIDRITAKAARVQCVPGLDYRATVKAILDQRWAQMIQAGEGGASPLIQHESALEQIVSDESGWVAELRRPRPHFRQSGDSDLHGCPRLGCRD